jgi:hypothetical protein
VIVGFRGGLPGGRRAATSAAAGPICFCCRYRNDVLACEFGSSSEAGRPLPRVVAHVRAASRRWIGAETGSYHDGENDLADRLEGSFQPGMLNLADRGFFSMDRFCRFSAARADLAWRVKNSA